MQDYEKIPVEIKKSGPTFLMGKVVAKLEQLIDTFSKFSVTFPETQKVEVINSTPIQKVEVVNQEKPLQKIDFPAIQPVAVTNQLSLPVGEGNIAGKANPSKYVPVRLTNGEKFYNALEDAYVAAAAKSPQFVDVNGKPTFVQLDSQGRLPTVAGGATVSTTSGSPLFVYPVNIPTTQQVYVVNPSAATVTTTSGSPLFNYITNWPTTQQVYVVNPSSATVSTTSGTALDVKVGNYPTIQTVNVQNMPIVTSVSGSVVVSQMPAITSTSGTLHAFVDNIPTIQKVDGSGFTQPVSLNSTSISSVTPGTGNTNLGAAVGAASGGTKVGTLAIGIRDDVLSALTPTDGQYTEGLRTDANGSHWVHVSAIDALTTVTGTVVAQVSTTSGTAFDTRVSNFPTIQTVNIQNIPTSNHIAVPSATSTGLTPAFTGSLSNIPWTVKASAGNLFGYHIYNPNSTTVYIQVFNTTSGTTTVGSTAPAFVLAVPALGALDAMSAALPVGFSTAIVLAATTTFNGSTAPTTPLVTDVFYS